MDWVTEFNIGDNVNYDFFKVIVPLLLGLVMLFSLLRPFIGLSEDKGFKKSFLPPKYEKPLRFIFGCGALAIGLRASGIFHLSDHDISNDPKYSVVEGEVKVYRTQPHAGHAPGDSIEIDGQPFVIDHFVLSKYYKQTIARKGLLRKGNYVRVYHVDGDIARIDIKK